MSRYKKIPGTTGLRKDLRTGKYNAYKKVHGKQYSENFAKISDAKRWLRTFNPLLQTSDEQESVKFEEAYELYKQYLYPTLTNSSIQSKEARMGVFLDDLARVPMEDISPQILERIIIQKKKECLKDPKSKRRNFNLPLTELKAFFNWYRESRDFRFYNPVTKPLFSLGIIKKKKEKSSIMTLGELELFISSFDDEFYRDFALIQFFCGGRWGEIAGIQKRNVDIPNRALLIKETVVTGVDRRFLELKPTPKNGSPRVVPISSEAFLNALLRRLKCSAKDSPYLFEKNGEPVVYRSTQHHYNKALRKAGLKDRFSSTHIIRYCVANLARQEFGSIDSVQAVTGHKSRALAEHYSRMPSNLQVDVLNGISKKLSPELQKLFKAVQSENEEEESDVLLS